MWATRICRNIARQAKRVPPIAFAFDIDGVLLRGPNVLPEAKKALEMLEGNNPFNMKIPYILLTNGGGVSEEDRCRKLTKQLGFSIHPSQYVQAHTILSTVAPRYASSPVLVMGGKLDAVRKVAHNYGFQKAYTSLDILAWNSSVWPFHTLSPEERSVTKPIRDAFQTRIEAAFVFHDPRNWALDIQILCDLIQNNGWLARHESHNRSGSQEEPLNLIFCNPDLLWKSDFETPRFGQGAFREAFQGVYQALTGTRYPYTQYGKPTSPTFEFAGQALKKRAAEMYAVDSCDMKQSDIYMIGDNPESDIAGANEAGWNSILVHTGVYDPRDGRPHHEPTHEVNDVLAAVEWAFDRAKRV